jgi:hypothetical protein
MTHLPGSPLDVDRQRALTALREQYMTGRLSLADYEARVDRVIDAESVETINAALSDVASAPVSPVAAGDEEFEAGRRAVSAIFAERKLRGRWRAPGEIAAVAALGQIVLDFRDADIDETVTAVHAVAVLGSITIIVPPGMNVHLDVEEVLGDAKQKKLPPPSPDGTFLHVTGYAILGEVKVMGKE